MGNTSPYKEKLPENVSQIQYALGYLLKLSKKEQRLCKRFNLYKIIKERNYKTNTLVKYIVEQTNHYAKEKNYLDVQPLTITKPDPETLMDGLCSAYDGIITEIKSAKNYIRTQDAKNTVQSLRTVKQWTDVINDHIRPMSRNRFGVTDVLES